MQASRQHLISLRTWNPAASIGASKARRSEAVTPSDEAELSEEDETSAREEYDGVDSNYDSSEFDSDYVRYPGADSSIDEDFSQNNENEVPGGDNEADSSREVCDSDQRILKQLDLQPDIEEYSDTLTRIQQERKQLFNTGIQQKCELTRHITLSCDQTGEGNFGRQRLLALRSNPFNETKRESILLRDKAKYALKDYQMQLMLLEQQNKKRLLMARQELDQEEQEYNTVMPSQSSHVDAGIPADPAEAMPKPDVNHITIADDTPSSLSTSLQNYEALEGPELVQVLRKRIAELEGGNSTTRSTIINSLETDVVKVFYRIGLDPISYLEEPTWSMGSKRRVVLKGHSPIGDLNNYLKYNNHLPFVVVKTYHAETPEESTAGAVDKKTALLAPEVSNESIIFVSDDMKAAAASFIRCLTNVSGGFVDSNLRDGVIHAPYLFWYHCRSFDGWTGMTPHHEELMRKLTEWIDQNYRMEYARTDALFEKGVVTFATMAYLVRPGDVLLSYVKKNQLQAYMARGWASYSSYGKPKKSKDGDIGSIDSAGERRNWSWRIPAWTYVYEGTFYKNDAVLELLLRTAQLDEEVNMQDINVIPLRFVGEEARERLELRGNRFWSCRNRQLVSYQDSPDAQMTATSERYMIDFATYAELEPDAAVVRRAQFSSNAKRKTMEPTFLERDEPPPAPDLYLFPRQIIGYNLRRKKWDDLDVDRIRDIHWNKRAFDYLVVDEETKELVLALITNKLAAEKGADLIENKGTGLIMLLHGGPGTGKTLTAESVAEVAEKPLFRVTCGDIGTKAEEVEKYLQSVLHLAKIWDCVVLLDEADVFLEQRTLNDLERNALVSVFLRILEYYEGILILTSNRVGTFDEAFKSRIQLSLHYENLTKSQRIKIWKNFFNRLKLLPEKKIDFDDVESYFEELAEHDMNGRQIRNAITTARQLAQFKNKIMNYSHLRHVIRVAGKFDTYLKNVQEGFSDDQIARGDGVR